MAKAFQAPRSRYRFARYITSHAVLRLRERLDAEGIIDHLDDQALSKMLDFAVSHAEDHPDEQRIRRAFDHGDPIKVVNLRRLIDRLDGDDGIWAVVKRNDEPDPPEAIVTVYTDALVEQKFASGRWSTEDTPVSDSSFNPVLSQPPPDVAAAGAEAAAQPAPPPPRSLFIIDDGNEYHNVDTAHAAAARIEEILQLDPEAAISLYRRIDFAVRRVVRVDIPEVR